MTTEEAFRKDIKDNPGDPVPLLIYADWLADHDRPDEALACRWMAKRGLHPRRRLRYQDGRRVPLDVGWGWYPDRGGSDSIDGLYSPPEHAQLPRLVFHAVAGHVGEHKYCCSWEEAFAALARGLKLLQTESVP